MVECTPDSWVLFVLEPFDANRNDTTKLEDSRVKIVLFSHEIEKLCLK